MSIGVPDIRPAGDEPGRVGIYRFSPPADVTSVQVNSTSPCEGGPTHGYCDDTPEPTVLSPGQLCFGYAHPVSPGSTELILVWSNDAKKGPYPIGSQRS